MPRSSDYDVWHGVYVVLVPTEVLLLLLSGHGWRQEAMDAEDLKLCQWERHSLRTHRHIHDRL